MGLPPTPAARPRDPQRPASAQTGYQPAAQRARALHIDRLVNGFVADPHYLLVREVELQAARNLLLAPCRRPSPWLPTPMSGSFPGYGRPRDRSPARYILTRSSSRPTVVCVHTVAPCGVGTPRPVSARASPWCGGDSFLPQPLDLEQQPMCRRVRSLTSRNRRPSRTRRHRRPIPPIPAQHRPARLGSRQRGPCALADQRPLYRVIGPSAECRVAD